MVSIEEAAESSEYAWAPVANTRGFDRVTLLGPGVRPAWPAWEIARRIGPVLSRYHPDAVAVPGWSDPAALAAIGWAARRGVPAILMSESSALDGPRRGLREHVKRRVIGLCNAGLVSGTPHAEYLADLGMPRLRVFLGYGAVDNSHFACGARTALENAAAFRTGHGLPERYFLASSRFVAKKNLFCLLDAYAAYRAAASPGAWHLVLLGDGPLGGELRRRVTERGLQDFVHFPGFQQYAELPIYYGLAKAFVHASTTEQWGLVVNEAMASGLPVLVSDCCGCAPDLVSGENGETFAPTDTAALAAGFARMAAREPAALAAMGAASRRRIEGWSPENFACQLEQAVNVALNEPPPRAGLADYLLLRLLIAAANRAAARLLPSPSESVRA